MKLIPLGAVQTLLSYIKIPPGLDIAVMDNDLRMIAGTGWCKKQIGKTCSCEPGLKSVLQNNKPTLIEGEFVQPVKKLPKLSNRNCPYNIGLIYPLTNQEEINGLVGLLGGINAREIIIQRKHTWIRMLARLSTCILEETGLFSETSPGNKIYSRPVTVTIAEPHNQEGALSGLRGSSQQIQKVKELAIKAAATDLTVLITGETGTGKELLAKAIHEVSSRREGPFIVANVSAIPESLAESELFGYENGAFTNASKLGRRGLFELAHGGTLFLDEIGDLSWGIQVKLLRLLEDKEVRRLGSNRTFSVDVRIIAATNRNLEEMVDKQLFRRDLFYRLNVFPIALPPLRQRKEDIPELVNHFCHQHNQDMPSPSKPVSEEVLELFYNYDWPGNIRELRNAINYALTVGKGNRIVLEDLPPYLVAKKDKTSQSKTFERVPTHLEIEPPKLVQLKKQAIEKALAYYGTSTHGKRQAAKALGISLSTLYRHMKLFELPSK